MTIREAVAYEDGVSAGEARGLAQGERTAKLETARNFLKMGLTVQQVAQGTGLSEEEIAALQAN